MRATDAQVENLEKQIDVINIRLEPLNSFVLPGGTALAATLHMARALVRRAEREATELATVEEVNPSALKYLNRLSDLLFQMARDANDCGRQDVLWVPGANR
ncbi:MAG: ATP:cob(I)alamin adenosyltransferase [Rhodospirillales bacterium]